MLLERLMSYYGKGGSEEIAYITRMCELYSEARQEEIFEYLTAEKGKKWGFPDLKDLKKAFYEVKPDEERETPACWWWNVCNKCGAQFWGNLPYCPICCDKGIVNERGNPHQDFSVKHSDVPPGKNVLRFNKPYYRTGVIPNDTVSCYECKDRGDSFCRFFADPRFDCNRRSECPCNACCMRLMER